MDVLRARFRDRADAGRRLASGLEAYRHRAGALVLALPRGGVPVGFEVATSLGLTLDVLLVRKLGVPGREELAMGALTLGGGRVLNHAVVEGLHLSPSVVDAVASAEQRVLEERSRIYRGDRPAPVVAGRTVILVDDGLATGMTMRAALSALRQQRPGSIVVAVPVAPPGACEEMRELADEVVCEVTSDAFVAVGQWYDDFAQTTDEEVRDLLVTADSLSGGPP
ncbi:MAG: phosphoribosyltransferase [Acidimicrobiales bacterium]